MLRYLRLFLAVTSFASAVLFCSYTQVLAVPELNFDQLALANNSGVLSYDGSGALIGTDIVFETVVATGVNLKNNVVLYIQNGSLNFSTGTNISEGTTYTFQSGGYFYLTGKVYEDAAFTKLVADGSNQANALISGYWTGTPTATYDSASGKFNIQGFGLDSKNLDLLKFYAIDPQNFSFANTDISTNGTIINQDGSFNANVANADITNTAIPEPASLLLLGSSLVAVGLLRSRKPS